MILHFQGSSSKLPRYKIRQFLPWCLEKLGIDIHQCHNITLTICLYKFTGPDNGYCTQLSSKEYIIELNKNLDPTTIMMVFAHECVHLKQYIKGELSYIDDTWAVWKFRKYNMDEIHYYDLPWEIEAAGREHGLCERFENLI